MKIILVAANDSRVNYDPLSQNPQGLAFSFQTLTDFLLDREPCDFLVMEQRAIGPVADIQRLGEKIPLDRIFLILESVQMGMMDSYLSQGIRDIFVTPFNFAEFAVKLKHATQIRPSLAFENCKLGMSGKKMMIAEILIMRGPRGASREEILREVWGEEKVGPKNVDVHINGLRKTFEK